MRFCSTQLQPVEAASKSDPYKRYVVTLRPVESAHPSCSCMAWIMARSRARKALGGSEVNADLPGKCKHLDKVLSTACMWEGEGETCAECGAATVAVGEVVERPEIVAEPAGPAPTVGQVELRPMLANEIDAGRLPRFITDDRWWAQQKVDGHRVCIHVLGGRIAVLGRSGQSSQHTARMHRPAYADIFRLDGCVIDGELVGDVYWVFDLPYHEGESITTASPYQDRQEALERVFDKWAPDERYFRLLPTAKTSIEKGQLAIDLLKAQAEGVMLKDVAGEYQPGGRVSTVLKAKYVKEVDVVVTKVKASGKDNYTYSVHRDGKLIDPDGDGIGRCSAIGKVDCRVGDVITVRFLYLAENDRLYQPRLVCKRDDKTAVECTWDQLEHAKVNKTVHPTL